MKKILYITLTAFLVFSLSGCGSEKQNSSSPQEESITQQPSTEAVNQAENTLNDFIEAYNNVSASKLSKIDDLKNNTVSSNMQSFFDKQENLTQGVYEYDLYSGAGANKHDYLGVAISENEIRVQGMCNNNSQTEDTFEKTFLLISKDATEAMFEQIDADETFLYGGKDGEMAGVTYTVDGYGGYHVVTLSAPLNIKNF